MPCHTFSALRALACLSLALPIAMARAEAGPQDPAAPVPELIYRSPLAGSPTSEEQSVESWRDANDNVGRIGGWRTYAREAWEDDVSEPESGSDDHHQH